MATRLKRCDQSGRVHFWTISCYHRLSFFWNDRIKHGVIAGLERPSLLRAQRLVSARNGLRRAVADRLVIEASRRCLSVPLSYRAPTPAGWATRPGVTHRGFRNRVAAVHDRSCLTDRGGRSTLGGVDRGPDVQRDRMQQRHGRPSRRWVPGREVYSVRKSEVKPLPAIRAPVTAER